MEELRQLGRYQLTRVLGRGAMGVVYEGTDPKLNRQIAVKTILKSHIADKDLEAEYSARFIREAQAVARLNHPNIVTVFDFGEENDIAFIVMELIRGDELKTYFDEKRQFSLEDAIRMTGELLDALDYAHSNGIVHRDIKPANVMLDGQSRVKLTDFGVARLSESGAERTQAGTMVGTPSYMSPEQIEGSAVGPRSDIFAVGIILYQFLTGEKPFHAPGLWAIQKKIMQEDPVLPSVIKPSLPPALDAIILRALAKKPDDRYANARDFKQDLQRVLAGAPAEDLDATRMVVRPRSTPAVGGEGEGSGMRTGATGTGSGAARNDETSGTAGLEIEFWRSVKDSSDVEEVEAYLKRFPNGVYTELAQRKLAKLRGETTSATGSLKPPFAQSTQSRAASGDEEDATQLVTGTRPPTASGGGTPPRPTVSTPTPAPAPTASGNKMLIPGLALGAALLAGGGYFLFGGDKPAPAPAPAPIATPAPATSAPTPNPAEEAKRLEAEKAEAAKKEAERLEAEKKEAEKREAEKKELEKLKADAAKKDLSPEEKKKIEEEVRKKAEEAAKKREEELAKKKLADEAKKAAAEEAAKKKAEDDKKKADEAAKKKADEEAARKKAEEEAAKKKALDEAAKKVEASPAPQATPAAPSVSPAALRAEASALEGQGKMREAVKLYKQAALAGDGEAAKRLGNIYGKGEGGIARDYAESVRWNDIARKRGIDVPKGDKL